MFGPKEEFRSMNKEGWEHLKLLLSCGETYSSSKNPASPHREAQTTRFPKHRSRADTIQKSRSHSELVML